MASFNNGQIILKEQPDQVVSPGINEISFYYYNGKLYAKDGNGTLYDILNPSMSGASQDLSGYTLLSITSAISAGLDTRLVANTLVDSQQTNSINTLFSTYTNSSTVAAISAGLDSRITDGSTAPLTNSINTLFSTYTNSATTQAISAGLNTRVSANELTDSQQTNSINTLFSTYANTSTVAAISAGLNARIIGSGGSTDLSPYTLLTTTAAISAGLQSQISAISGSGNGGTPLTVTFGATTVSDVTTMNFVGVASLTTPLAGTAIVTISGGSGSGGSDPTVTSLTAQTFSPDGLSDVYDYTISASSTVTLNAPTSIVNGKSIIFKFTQPSGANAPLTLADGSGFTWKTPNGALTLTTDTGNAVDIITVLRIGTNLYASIVKNLS